jgi:hypothetical protein
MTMRYSVMQLRVTVQSVICKDKTDVISFNSVIELHMGLSFVGRHEGRDLPVWWAMGRGLGVQALCSDG